MAHEAVDRHAYGPRRDYLALRWLGKDGTIRDCTYGDLQEQSNRFANVLASLGVDKGDRVFTLAGRIPALYIAAPRWRFQRRGPIALGSMRCWRSSALRRHRCPLPHRDWS